MSETGSAARVTLGIDIGTTSVKAVAADEDGNVVARARVPHQVHSRVAGEFEHDVDEAWRAGVVAALAQVGDGPRRRRPSTCRRWCRRSGAVDADGRGVGPGSALRRPPGRARRRRPDPARRQRRAARVPRLARRPLARGGGLLAGPGRGQPRPHRPRRHRHHHRDDRLPAVRLRRLGRGAGRRGRHRRRRRCPTS